MTSKAVLVALGVAVAAMVAWWCWPSGAQRVDPPQVLQERVLQGSSPEVQSQAAQDMVKYKPSEEARTSVHQALAEYRGNEPEVLVPLVQSVLKQRDHKSLPRLLDLMEHPDPRVRGKAGAALSEIMGADYGFRAGDPPEKRRKVLKYVREIYPAMLPKIERFYSEQQE
jgi:hypothetical protein